MDLVHYTPIYPFYGLPLDQVWIRLSRGWPERDFLVIVQLFHVGPRFEALDALIFIVPSISPCIFLTSLDFPLERCVPIALTPSLPLPLTHLMNEELSDNNKWADNTLEYMS